jgi:hypothetical protein
MKKVVVALLVATSLVLGSSAFAQESECDCSCVKGGIGLPPIDRFNVAILGFKQYNNLQDCEDKYGIGLGIMLGKKRRIEIGVGFDKGMIGLGIGFRGDKKVTFIGPAIGYDYSDCRLVWPIEE